MASGRRLLTLLAAVERGLSAPAASAAEAEGLLETAYDAGELAQHRASVMGAPPKTLIRQLVAIARKMIALDAALCSSGGTARHIDLGSMAAVDQINATCVAMEAACMIVQTLQLQPSTAPPAAEVRELVASLVVVLSSGRASLEVCCKALASASPGSRAAELFGERLAQHANLQVVAANAAFGIHGVAGGSIEGTTLALAFPGWLVSLGSVLVLSHEQNRGKPPGIRLWAAYATLAVHASLLMQPAVRASPASQQAIVDVLLGCCLPALEAECRAAHGAGHSADPSSMAHSGGHAAHAALLSNHSDEPAVAQHALLSTLPSLLANTDAPVGGAVKAYLAQQPPAAHSALRSAVSIVAALPEHPPPAGSTAADWLAGHQLATQLLCLLLSMQAASQPPEVQVAQWLDELQLVPHVVAVMRQLGSNRQPSQAGRPADLAIWSYCVLLQHVGIQTTNLQKSNAPMFTSPAGVTQWAAAAEAALRLLPLLASLVTQPPRSSPCWDLTAAEAVQSCARSLLFVLWEAPSSQLRGWSLRLLAEPVTAAQASEAATQLWQLQRTASCALHYLAKEGRLAELDVPSPALALPRLLWVLSMQFVAAHICMQLAWGGSRSLLRGERLASTSELQDSPEGPRRMQALCSTMWRAILLVAGMPGSQEAVLHCDTVHALLGILGELGDTQGFEAACLLHRALHHLTSLPASGLPADWHATQEGLYNMLHRMVPLVEHIPWVAPALAASGVLAQFVAMGRARSSHPQGESTVTEMGDMLQGNWGNGAAAVLGALKRCAHEALSKLAGSAEQQPEAEVAAQLRAALAALEAATSGLERVEAALVPAAPVSLRKYMGFFWAEHINDDVLRCAAQLGAALRRYQLLPAQQEAAQVQLALAAAARGCSNLACANLERARARELDAGKPNQLCSACRVARFCCAACQVDDWKHGGHRRVCRLLKAAKAAQEEQPA